MNLSRLYKTLVVGGAALTFGACGSTHRGAGATEGKEPAAKTAGPLPCSALCTGTGREAFCPEADQPEVPLDDRQKANLNCCWLMSPQHRCCDAPPELPAPR